MRGGGEGGWGRSGEVVDSYKKYMSSLSIYFISIFFISKGVWHKLEKIQRDFMWGGGLLKISGT